MKKIHLALFAVLLLGCQSEETTIVQNNSDALVRTSPLTSLVSRVCQNPTHVDDILDQSSCYSVLLPVNVMVNGEDFNVEDQDDFHDIWENMQESWSDDDIVHFQFPITVVFPDFAQLVVNNQAQLDALTCPDDGNFHEIRCVDFVFPVSVNTYDTNNQIANTVTIYNNAGFYDFIENLASAEIFTVVYPVSLTLASGQTVVVNSNHELEDAIEDAIDDCDDNWGGPGPEPLTLEQIVVSGTWHISYCDDRMSRSPQPPNIYEGYNFTFSADGTVTAEKNSVVSNGTWSVYQDGSHTMMDLFFPQPQLQGLTDDHWKVTEYNPTNFRLKEDHDNRRSGGGNEYIYFTKN